jgi:hypothetical protein
MSSVKLEVKAAISGPFNDALFKKLVRLCHPDVDPSLIQEFHALNKWRDSVDVKIKISAGRGYEISAPKWTGHLTNIYEANELYLKISKHPKANPLIKNEFAVLTELQKLPPQCRHYFFKPIEFMELKDKVQLSSFSYEAAPLISLKTVMEYRPNGLTDPEFGWIVKRILAGIDFLHMAGYTHTNIISDHILLNADNHGAIICGLAGATKDASKMKLTEQPFLGPELDVWQIGKLAQTLTQNKRFISFFKSLTLSKNLLPTDLAAVSKEFSQILPPSKFVPFSLE